MKAMVFRSQGAALNMKDWGSIVDLANMKIPHDISMFSASIINYEAPHHSGIHDFTELMFFTEGAGVVKVEETSFSIEQGCLLVIPAGMDHGVVTLKGKSLKAYVLHLK